LNIYFLARTNCTIIVLIKSLRSILVHIARSLGVSTDSPRSSATQDRRAAADGYHRESFQRASLLDRYLVIGNPVAHSRSPEIHSHFARQTGQSISYGRLLVEPGDFARAAAAFFSGDGCGANVTLPFKGDAYAYAESRTDRAEEAQAVNTLLRRGDGVIVGDNTDGAGLVRDLIVNLGCPLAGRRILIVGAGGAARGVVGPLLREQPAELVVANRTASRAEALARRFGQWGPIRGRGLGPVDGPFDIVIHASSSGTRGEAPALPAGAIGPATFAYDMAYGASAAPFAALALAGGAGSIADGLGMLVEQAAESFELWRGVRPLTAPVIAQLRESLA